MRTCVGCRRSAAKGELLRVVNMASVLIPDPHGEVPGRGGYLHESAECLLAAEQRRAWSRAFRAPGPFDSSAVHTLVATAAGADQTDRESAVRTSTR
jgi:predicted RNA-binding protein YlxR (DUF448 family)